MCRYAAHSLAFAVALVVAGCPLPGHRAEPTAGFTAKPICGLEPLQVDFTDESIPGEAAITGWHWTFGDGGASTLRDPTHVYVHAGEYSVSLMVTTAIGSDAITKTAFINVDALPLVVVNEFNAGNASGLTDEDGDFEDWIELFNASDASVSLDGWTLTDDAAEMDKWRFPNVTLAGGDYLVVFASGKDRGPQDGCCLHANFRLNMQGEYLALTDETGRVMAEFGPEYAPQSEDVSYGRFGPECAYYYFDTPTPGEENVGGVQ